METVREEVRQSQERSEARRMARQRYADRTRWLWLIAWSSLMLALIAGAVLVFS